MTEYQFQFGFVPSAALPQRLPANYPAIKDLPACTAGLWKHAEFPDSLIESLDGLLPGFRLANATQLFWGERAGTSVEVSFEGRLLTNFIVNVDVRLPHIALVSELSLIAKRQRWLVITSTGEVFRPSVRRFLTEIQLSPAMRRARSLLDSRARRQS